VIKGNFACERGEQQLAQGAVCGVLDDAVSEQCGRGGDLGDVAFWRQLSAAAARRPLRRQGLLALGRPYYIYSHAAIPTQRCGTSNTCMHQATSARLSVTGVMGRLELRSSRPSGC
jgi:hypothetical protein